MKIPNVIGVDWGATRACSSLIIDDPCAPEVEIREQFDKDLLISLRFTKHVLNMRAGEVVNGALDDARRQLANQISRALEAEICSLLKAPEFGDLIKRTVREVLVEAARKAAEDRVDDFLEEVLA